MRAEKKKDTGIPEFKSLEEEREYWEARGPLAEGHRGTIHRPKPGEKHSSFLAVRMTGEEIDRLREAAARYGVGTSTFARIILRYVIENQSQTPAYVARERPAERFDASPRAPKAVTRKRTSRKSP